MEAIRGTHNACRSVFAYCPTLIESQTSSPNRFRCTPTLKRCVNRESAAGRKWTHGRVPFSRGDINQCPFDIFVRKRIYLRYAEASFGGEQIDIPDELRVALHQALALPALTKSDYEGQCLTVNR